MSDQVIDEGAKVRGAEERLGGKFLCPRRALDVGDTSVFKLPQTDEWREGHVCSYCGSLSGFELMRRLEDGTIELEPTDKNYKVYVKATDGTDLKTVKHYWPHLDDQQKNRFIELLNARRINVGYPGHFYVLPYFCVRASKK